MSVSLLLVSLSVTQVEAQTSTSYPEVRKIKYTVPLCLLISSSFFTFCCPRLIFSEAHYYTTDTQHSTPLISFHNRCHKHILNCKFLFALTTKCGHKLTLNLYDWQTMKENLSPPPYPPVTLS
jgi:hypothetical protein